MHNRILLDVDGILADFVTPVVKRVNEYLSTSYVHDDVKEWDIAKGLGIPEDRQAHFYKQMQYPGFCASLEAYPGAAYGVDRLRSVAEVWAVTAPFGGLYWMPERDQWLQDKFGFKKNQILHVRGEAKHAIAADFLVEDKTSTLIDWKEHNPLGHGVLFQRPWNINDGWVGKAAPDWISLVRVIMANLGDF